MDVGPNWKSLNRTRTLQLVVISGSHAMTYSTPRSRGYGDGKKGDFKMPPWLTFPAGDGREPPPGEPLRIFLFPKNNKRKNINLRAFSFT